MHSFKIQQSMHTESYLGGITDRTIKQNIEFSLFFFSCSHRFHCSYVRDHLICFFFLCEVDIFFKDFIFFSNQCKSIGKKDAHLMNKLHLTLYIDTCQ